MKFPLYVSTLIKMELCRSLKRIGFLMVMTVFIAGSATAQHFADRVDVLLTAYHNAGHF
ncbi:MAG: hypothetical protein AB8G77_06580 [Rhodothermales bacterium]